MLNLIKKNIAGIKIIFNNLEDISNCVINSENQTILSTLSMPLLGELHENRDYFNALENSEIVLPDGMGIVLLSKIIYGKDSIKKRVTGPDFFLFFNEKANKNKLKYFFLGSTIETLEKIENKIKAEYPDIIISGTLSPPFGNWDEKINNEILKKINDANPDVLWVAMTAPKQEIWVYENRDRIKARIIASIGAAFDFFAGTKRRAPEIFRRLGLEWLYRIFQEPFRMGKRYLKGFPYFIFYLFKGLKKRGEK